MLSGTLLPAPMIGERGAAAMRAAVKAGHGAGVHGWDHVGWHDRLDAMSLEQIRSDYGQAHAEFLRIFGIPARASAAPGWTVNGRSLEVQEERALLFTSDTRGGSYFFPQEGGRTFRTLEIPTTLPTLDETLAWPELRSDEDQRGFFREAARGTQVHTIHAEVEGGSKAASSRRSWTTGSRTASRSRCSRISPAKPWRTTTPFPRGRSRASSCPAAGGPWPPAGRRPGPREGGVLRFESLTPFYRRQARGVAFGHLSSAGCWTNTASGEMCPTRADRGTRLQLRLAPAHPSEAELRPVRGLCRS